MKNTNLCQVKMTAQTLLRVRIHKTDYSPMIVRHPFASSGLVVLPGTQKIIDITANAENLNVWQDAMSNQIAKAKTVFDIYTMLNKPYALTFLKFIQDSISAKELAVLLADAWIRSECPNMNVDVSKPELVELFEKADKEHLMTESERGLLSWFGDKVTVYRGVTSYNAKNVRALSWTIDKKKAEWFAHRFDERGTVYTAQIEKEKILAVFTSRNESEIVLNPKGLKQLKKVEGTTHG